MSCLCLRIMLKIIPKKGYKLEKGYKMSLEHPGQACFSDLTPNP